MKIGEDKQDMAKDERASSCSKGHKWQVWY